MVTVRGMPVDEQGGEFITVFIGVWRVDGVVSPVNPESVFCKENGIWPCNAVPIDVSVLPEFLLRLLLNDLEDSAGVGE